jgi:two-component sensor histidine kinase
VASGDPVRLSGRAVLTLSIVLHELVTNAAKHGALSRPEGRVQVQWRRHANEVELVWKESGGPAVTAPTRRGFGLRLISDSISYELGGEAVFDFDPRGLICTIRVPASADVSVE